jgi:hypothetical protein
MIQIDSRSGYGQAVLMIFHCARSTIFLPRTGKSLNRYIIDRLKPKALKRAR